MAGDWIRIEHATPDKPEIHRIARVLGIDADLAFAKCVRFWIWLDSHCVDGTVDGSTSLDVDRIVGAPGFAGAAEKVGWLEVDDEAEILTVPNFSDLNGESAKKRGLKSRRQMRYRQKLTDRGSAGVDGGASTIASRGAETVDGGASTDASTREEKRREEGLEGMGKADVAESVRFSRDLGDHPDGESFEDQVESVFRWVENNGATLPAIPSADTVRGFVAHYRGTGWHDRNDNKVRSWPDKLRRFRPEGINGTASRSHRKEKKKSEFQQPTEPIPRI